MIEDQLQSGVANQGVMDFEAMARLLKMPIDLIIMDWRLPVMEGIDVLYMIRSNPKMQQPKIIFCSSLIEEAKIREALQGGADDYIMKPFDEEIIESKIIMLGLM